MTRSDTKQIDPCAADTDADAVARCVAGDQLGLEQLYARHGRVCLALARQILIDRHYAEDAVQEAFLHLWRNSAAFNGTRSSARTWLIMLTRSRAIDRVRYEQRRSTDELEERHDRSDDREGPDAQAISAALGRETVAALAVLTPVQREALVLAYWGGYTQREIAAITGTPLGTVKTRTRSALAALSRHLVPQDEPGLAVAS